MNNKSLQDLVKGCYGRKILYTDVETITADNIVKVVGDCIGNYYYNSNWKYQVVRSMGWCNGFFE